MMVVVNKRTDDLCEVISHVDGLVTLRLWDGRKSIISVTEYDVLFDLASPDDVNFFRAYAQPSN